MEPLAVAVELLKLELLATPHLSGGTAVGGAGDGFVNLITGVACSAYAGGELKEVDKKTTTRPLGGGGAARGKNDGEKWWWR